jgi:hypothetical protein
MFIKLRMFMIKDFKITGDSFTKLFVFCIEKSEQFVSLVYTLRFFRAITSQLSDYSFKMQNIVLKN